MIIVDSSIYIQWLRQRIELHEVLEPWIRTSQLFCCGIIRAEVIRGIIPPRIKNQLHTFFDFLNDIPISREICYSASELAWTLDRKGVVLPVTDIIIACCAKKAGAVVISDDKHFRRIPGVESRASLTDL